MSLMGIDVGTTGCKVVAFAETGAVLDQAGREYPLISPQPGWYELDPERVWRDVCACLREVNAQIGHDPVSALAISSQGEAMTPIARDGRILANSPISSDTRNRAQAAEMEAALGAEHIYALTGQPMGTFYTLPKVLWWRDNAPEILDQTWKFLCYVDFVAYRLGLEPAIDYSMAARTLAFDVRKLDWSEELLEAGGVRRDQLARPAPSGTVLGEIPPKLAADLGFTGGNVKVVTGGHDQPAGALGAGVLQPGRAMLAIGTTEALVAVTDEPRPEMLDYHVSCYPHAAPGLFIALSGNQTGGRLLRWYRDELAAAEKAIAAADGRDVYDVIVEQTGDEPGGLLLLPYFVGSGTYFEDPAATGTLVGMTFDTKRADIVRAILEGLTYEQALGISGLNEVGAGIKQLTAIGGGARSERWMQIKADITDLPVTIIHTSEAASLGVAMLAGWATGVYGSLEEAAALLIKPRKTFTPRAEHRAHYRRQLSIYSDLYQALRPIYQAMAAEG
ncbi:MAG: FGGY family carbohydrate kinase [Chloroflexi bacterium]|nr:FGGY family carbohydrate kinase [Chloroflexota bacterium]